MRILLVGKNGQLGWELQRACSTLGEIISVDYPEIDLSNNEGIRNLIQTVKPDLLINAAAYTNVDKAESEPELAYKVNAFAPGGMAEEMKKLKGAFIHYSTDYVFDGTQKTPYVETDFPKPLNIYGMTKYDGELKVQEIGGAFLIFRTSWVYSLRQGGFVSKVLQWARQQETLKIVDDQIANPTWARLLAEITSQVISLSRDDPFNLINEISGLYHLAGSGFTSRYDWAKTILNLDPRKNEQVVKEVLPVPSSEFPTPAQRPGFSALNCSKFYSTMKFQLPVWKHALDLAMSNDSSYAELKKKILSGSL